MDGLIYWFTHTYAPSDPTFWVLISLLIFIGILLWAKVPRLGAKALDERAAAIAKELEDARRMREEAAALLAKYQQRQREAEGEAEALVAQAKAEADRLRAETRRALEERIAARTRMAEDKIARAEKQAEADVRAAAANLAVKAAEQLIRDKLDDASRARIFDASLKDMERRLQ